MNRFQPDVAGPVVQSATHQLLLEVRLSVFCSFSLNTGKLAENMLVNSYTLPNIREIYLNVIDVRKMKFEDFKKLSFRFRKATIR